MSLGGVQALAVELAHGEMLRVDGGVFTRDAKDAVVVGAGGTVALDGLEAGLKHPYFFLLEAMGGSGGA
eukprot:13808790-Heterocapsa_arctica.AAC.1